MGRGGRLEDKEERNTGVEAKTGATHNPLGWDSDDAELLLADGYEDAIIGIVHVHGNVVVLYDADKCVKILMDRDGMTEEEAVEYFNYNTVQAYVGPRTPAYAFLRRPDEQGHTDLLA